MSEFLDGCMWCGLLRQPHLIQVFETEFWRVYLAPEQTYVGKSIAVLRRHAPGEAVMEAEASDMSVVEGRLYFRTRAEFFAKRVDSTPLARGLLATHANFQLYPRYGPDIVEIARGEDKLVFSDPGIDPEEHLSQTSVPREIQELIALKLWPTMAKL